MTHPDAFLQATLDAPDDDTPRLVFADWLDDHGDAARAEFIRVQCALARLPEDDDRRWEWEAREQQLARERGKGWAGPLRRLLKRWAFRRGFVESVALRAADFLRHSDAIFRLAPVRHVRLFDAAGRLEALAESPALGRLSGLDLRHQAVTLAELESLLRSPRLRRLTHLNLRGTPLCNNAGLRRVADCPNLAGLESLDLSDHRVEGQPSRQQRRRDPGDWVRDPAPLQVQYEARRSQAIDETGVRALAESPYLRSLRELALTGHHYRFQREALSALAGSEFLGRLTGLDLGFDHIREHAFHHSGGATGLRALLHSPHVARLRTVRLAGALLAEDSVAALASSPLAGGLTILDLSSNYLGTGDGYRARYYGDSLKMLAGASFPRLATLNLARCEMGNNSLVLLAQSTGFPALRRLHLDRNRFGRRGAQALARGPLLSPVRVLTAQGPGNPERHPRTRVGDGGARALAESPGAARLVYLDLGCQAAADVGVKALAVSPHLAGLRTLLLWHNRIGPKGAAALRASESLARLTRLDLRSNDVPAAERQALRERFGPGVTYGPGPSPYVRNWTKGAGGRFPDDEE